MTIRFGSGTQASTFSTPGSAQALRRRLQLGAMATQASTGVDITGGAINGVTLSGSFSSTAMYIYGGLISNTPIGATAASSANFSSVGISSNRYIPTSSGVGVRHGATTDSDWGWDDWTGDVHVSSTAGSTASPSWVAWNGGIKQFSFAVGDEVQNDFHVLHDYAPNTNIYIHVHHSHNLTTITTTGQVTFSFEASYAKGYRQQAFGTPVTPSVTTDASTVQRMHQITEVQLSGSAGSTSLLATTDLEIDGLIQVRTWLSANTLNGTPGIFIHMIDIHHQTRDGTGTKWKNYPFYTT